MKKIKFNMKKFGNNFKIKSFNTVFFQKNMSIKQKK